MNKESILTNQGEAWEYTNTLRVCPVEDAYNGMDLYAKQQAIAFGDWLYNNYTQSDVTNKWIERARPLTKNDRTTQELYNQFIEQQNKP